MNVNPSGEGSGVLVTQRNGVAHTARFRRVGAAGGWGRCVLEPGRREARIGRQPPYRPSVDGRCALRKGVVPRRSSVPSSPRAGRNGTVPRGTSRAPVTRRAAGGQLREPACKPGSVKGSHSSGMRVTTQPLATYPGAARATLRQESDTLLYSVLLQVGFTLPSVLPPTRCALTAPFHPYRRHRRPRTRGAAAVSFLWHFP